MRRLTSSHIALSTVLLSSACALPKTDDAAQFREALPRAEHVSVFGPENAEEGPNASLSAASRTRPLAETDAAPAPPARWYAFTRHVRDGVNGVTRAVLGSVWFVVHAEPTEVREDAVTWGPYTDPLEPATYRFRVRRVNAAAAEYEYVLEGRPKVSKNDADYRRVLVGHGFGRNSASHGDGEFTIDLDVARELDPVAHANQSGFVSITHELPRDVTARVAGLPRHIRARAEAADDSWYTVDSRAEIDGTGTLAVDFHGDIDETRQSAFEDVTVLSRWRADGAGRADIVIAGGDLPPGIPLVDAAECWGADFSSVYYADSANFSEKTGDATACAFAAPSSP